MTQEREKSAEPSSANEGGDMEGDADADYKKGAWTPEEDRLLSHLIEVTQASYHTASALTPPVPDC